MAGMDLPPSSSEGEDSEESDGDEAGERCGADRPPRPLDQYGIPISDSEESEESEEEGEGGEEGEGAGGGGGTAREEGDHQEPRALDQYGIPLSDSGEDDSGEDEEGAEEGERLGGVGASEVGDTAAGTAAPPEATAGRRLPSPEVYLAVSLFSGSAGSRCSGGGAR